MVSVEFRIDKLQRKIKSTNSCKYFNQIVVHMVLLRCHIKVKTALGHHIYQIRAVTQAQYCSRKDLNLLTFKLDPPNYKRTTTACSVLKFSNSLYNPNGWKMKNINIALVFVFKVQTIHMNASSFLLLLLD